MSDFWIVSENKFEILTEIILYNLEKRKVAELSKLGVCQRGDWTSHTGVMAWSLSWLAGIFVYSHLTELSNSTHTPHGMRHLSSWPRSLQLSLLEFIFAKKRNIYGQVSGLSQPESSPIYLHWSQEDFFPPHRMSEQVVRARHF